MFWGKWGLLSSSIEAAANACLSRLLHSLCCCRYRVMFGLGSEESPESVCVLTAGRSVAPLPSLFDECPNITSSSTSWPEYLLIDLPESDNPESTLAKFIAGDFVMVWISVGCGNLGWWLDRSIWCIAWFNSVSIPSKCLLLSLGDLSDDDESCSGLWLDLSATKSDTGLVCPVPALLNTYFFWLPGKSYHSSF